MEALGMSNRLLAVCRPLLAELDLQLDSLDSRWLGFGLNKPGAAETPDVPTHLHVVLNGLNGTLTWIGRVR